MKKNLKLALLSSAAAATVSAATLIGNRIRTRNRASKYNEGYEDGILAAEKILREWINPDVSFEVRDAKISNALKGLRVSALAENRGYYTDGKLEAIESVEDSLADEKPFDVLSEIEIWLGLADD